MKSDDYIFLVKESFREWSRDNVSRLAAALAYYTVFSLAPILVIAVSIAGWLLGQENVRMEVLGQIGEAIGPQARELVAEMIDQAMRPEGGIIAGIIGLVALLVSATGVFAELQNSLNNIWGVMIRPGRGILATIKDRLLAFGMVLAIGFLLLVSFIIDALISILGAHFVELLPFPATIIRVLSLLISLAVVTALFALIYKYIPDVEINWRDVWIGAIITAILFTIGRFALSIYLARAGVASAYGAAGALVLILLWVYYSAQVLFLGAEFTQVYANNYGSGITPSEEAIPLTREARARQGMPRDEEQLE
jgi:membrane protein